MVDSISTTNVGQSPFPTPQGVDPGILMMAVSLMHINAAHESARAKLGHLDEAFATLGRVAPLTGKIAQARDEVTKSELQATQGELAFTNAFQSRYVDNATVNEADNRRFRQQQAWAAERGIELEEVTKTIQEEIKVEVSTTDPKTGEVTTTTQTKTITREVFDRDAIARNEARLEAYQAALNSGTADNAVIRRLIADHPEIKAAHAILKELGQSLDLTTLSSLGAAVAELNAWRDELAAQIREHLASAKAVHHQLTKLDQEVDSHLQDAAELHARKTEHEYTISNLEQAALKLSFSKGIQMSEFLAALGEAISETEQYLLDIEYTS